MLSVSSLGKRSRQTFAVALDFSHLVVDTNVFINNLALLSSLRDWGLTIVVPFIGKNPYYSQLTVPVVNELDGLKLRQDAVGSSARVAITFLRDTLSKQENHFIGQSIRQTLLNTSPLLMRNNVHPDDRVLDCALYFNEQPDSYQGVVLITDVSMVQSFLNVAGQSFVG